MATNRIKKGTALFVIGMMTVCGVFSHIASAADNPAANTKTIVAFGGSHIYKNISAAKNAAIDESLKYAVYTAAAGLFPVSALTRNFDSFSKVLADNQQNFILDYKILKESQTDTDYRVLVQATVSMDKIEAALATAGLRAAPSQLPSILIMLAEKQPDDIDYSYWWQKGRLPFASLAATPPMKQVFREKGFQVIDPDITIKDPDSVYGDLNLTATPSDQAAVTLAKRLGADVVIVGTAAVSVMSNRMGKAIKTYKGSVSARALRADTGQQITAIHEESLAVSNNPQIGGQNALADASFKAAGELTTQIITEWGTAPETKGKVTLTLTGQDILLNLEAIKNSLTQIDGVASLSVSAMTPDQATLEIDYNGTAQELADKLLKQSFSGFGINITNVAPLQIAVDVINENKPAP